MRNWIDIVEAEEDFGSTSVLYHGTNLDNLWLIFKDGKLTPDFHGRGYEGPTGVCLSRSYKIAFDHANSWTENLYDSFFSYFGFDNPPNIGGVILEFDRSLIKQEIIPFDDIGDDYEEEERVVGELSLDALTAIHVNPDDIRTFYDFAVKSYEIHHNEYDAAFEKIIQQLLSDPRIKPTDMTA